MKNEKIFKSFKHLYLHTVIVRHNSAKTDNAIFGQDTNTEDERSIEIESDNRSIDDGQYRVKDGNQQIQESTGDL